MTHPDESDVEFRARLARLPRSIEPRRDLWAGIEQQIGKTPVRRPAARARWAMAAGVAGLALGVLLMWSMRPGVAPQVAHNAGVPSAAQVPGRLIQPPRGSAHEVSGQPGYAFVPASTDAIRQKLQAQVAARLAGMPPATREKVEKNLLIIKQAMNEIQSALAKDPGNALLQDLMVSTYQNELDTLANVQTLAGSAHSEVSL